MILCNPRLNTVNDYSYPGLQKNSRPPFGYDWIDQILSSNFHHLKMKLASGNVKQPNIGAV